MKEFDLEAAKAGAPVCTGDGRKARIICFDVKDERYPIVALVEEDGEEILRSYTAKGSIECEDADSLMMASTKHEGWINICKSYGSYATDGYIYATEETAKRGCEAMEGYIDTIKIEWEE